MLERITKKKKNLYIF